MARMERSRTARWLLAEARRSGIRVTLDSGLDSWGSYEHARQRILLAAPVSADGSLRGMVDEDHLILTLAHELRHAWQAQRGRFMEELELTPHDAAVANRLAEADAEAITVQIAWELRQSGDFGPWEADHAWFKDMYRAYERVAKDDPGAVRSGRAARAAFKQWFRLRRRVSFHDSYRLHWWHVDAESHPIRASRAKTPLTGIELRALGALSAGVNFIRSAGRKPLDLEAARYSGHFTRDNANHVARLSARYGAHPHPDREPAPDDSPRLPGL
jgi:hypothetical protein